MQVRILSALLLIAWLQPQMAATADEGQPCCCLCGKKVCMLEVKQDKEEITVLDVEAKEICIPGIKLPWECTRRCGGVRHICVIKEEKEEQQVCKYNWSIKTICTGCCHRHGLRCGKLFTEVIQDDKVPFEYVVAEPASVKLASALMPTPTTKPSSQSAVGNPSLLDRALHSSRSVSTTSAAQSSAAIREPVQAAQELNLR